MADSPNRLAGVAFVTVNGTSYRIVGEGTYRVSQEERETLKGQDGIHGYKAMPGAGKISWKGRDGNDVSIGALADADDATVVLELANGKTVIGRNMWRAGDSPIEVNTETGEFDVAFEGADVIEA
ncbi:MAG: phage tail protein [Frankiales bacterium]|nr:phage tail protein [Frankiales bacterium]